MPPRTKAASFTPVTTPDDPSKADPADDAGEAEPTPEEIKKYGVPTKNGTDKIFEAREVERDSSFLRRYLTEELMREMDMFQYESRGDELVIDKVSDEDGWKTVKET